MALLAHRRSPRPRPDALCIVVVVVGSLLMLSPPAAAPIADPIPAHGAHGPAYIETDPLVGPWPVERFLMPYPAETYVPIMQQSGTTRTPAAVLPAALLRPLRRIVSSAKLAVATLCTLARKGSAVIQLTADLVAHIRMTVSGGDALARIMHETSSWVIGNALNRAALQTRAVTATHARRSTGPDRPPAAELHA